MEWALEGPGYWVGPGRAETERCAGYQGFRNYLRLVFQEAAVSENGDGFSGQVFWVRFSGSFVGLGFRTEPALRVNGSVRPLSG